MPYIRKDDDMSVETKRNGCVGVLLWMLLVFLCGVILASMGSCKSVQYVPVETVRHDSVFITQHSKDSIYLHDSIHIVEKADTVLIERWHTRWRDRLRTDTIYISKVDTIQVPYPVERKLSKAEKMYINIGKWSVGVISGLLLVLVFYIFIRRWRFSS